MRHPGFLHVPVILAGCMVVAVCGGDTTGPSAENVTVAVVPSSIELLPGQTQQFTATVTGTDIKAVNWTASGGTITGGGLFTAGADAGEYVVTAASVVSATSIAEAKVTVRQVGVVIPISNRSRAHAGAADDSKSVTADSADFSGFAASLFAASSSGSASTDITAVFHREAGTGHMYLVESQSSSNANNTMPPDGTPSADNRLHLVFEVRHSDVAFTFTAACTSWGFDARLRKTDDPTRTYFDYDIMDEEFDDDACASIEEADVLGPGTYELYVAHSFSVPWDLEPGTFVEREGGYTMRLEFDQTPEL